MSGEKRTESQMIALKFSIPENELERLLALNELELDYADLDRSFADLTKLAAKIAGTSISMVNLIDTFTVWSVAPFGMDVKQSPREESVCQYTIINQSPGGMEVMDLSVDERFKDRAYVTESPYLKYYFGIPLNIRDNLPIGSLCVIHDDYKDVSEEKKGMLEIVAGEIVSRIKVRHMIHKLTNRVQECTTIKNNLAHDIRGPLGGIVGLAEIIQLQGSENNLEEVLRYISMIQKSGKSVLDLADEILSVHRVSSTPKDHEFTLATLEDRLETLFGPQAMTKDVKLLFQTTDEHAHIPFPKTNILQILGNLISNSIKFTPEGGQVKVFLDMEISDRARMLNIKVKDSGVGMSNEKIEQILNGKAVSSGGTSGEKGYGFGLNLVHQLVTKLNGRMLLRSEPGQGAEFELTLPVA
jgi:K+-sensing histidine kinase KdpD